MVNEKLTSGQIDEAVRQLRHLLSGIRGSVVT